MTNNNDTNNLPQLVRETKTETFCGQTVHMYRVVAHNPSGSVVTVIDWRFEEQCA